MSSRPEPDPDPTSRPEPCPDTCVARVPVFRGLSPGQQAEVSQFARPVVVTAGDQVVAAGAPERRLLVVHSGRVRVVHLLESGREHVVRMLGPGDVVGKASFILGRRPEHFVYAETDARLCTFDHGDLARLVSRYPDIAVRMLQVQAERLVAAERKLAAFGAGDVGARVAAYLLDLPAGPASPTSPADSAAATSPADSAAATSPASSMLVELPMAKKDVASYLGTTPETLSRRLRELTNAGAIEVTGRRGILILDADALIRRAET